MAENTLFPGILPLRKKFRLLSQKADVGIHTCNDSFKYVSTCYYSAQLWHISHFVCVVTVYIYQCKIRALYYMDKLNSYTYFINTYYMATSTGVGCSQGTTNLYNKSVIRLSLVLESTHLNLDTTYVYMSTN